MSLPKTSPTSLLMATFKQNLVLLSDMWGVGDVVSVFACDPFHTTRAGLLMMQEKLRTPRELSILACSLNGIFRKLQTDHSRPTVLTQWVKPATQRRRGAPGWLASSRNLAANQPPYTYSIQTKTTRQELPYQMQDSAIARLLQDPLGHPRISRPRMIFGHQTESCNINIIGRLLNRS